MKLSAKLVATFAAILSVFVSTATAVSADDAAKYPNISFGGFARVRADWPLAGSSTPTFSAPNARIEIKAAVSDEISYAFSTDSTAGTLKLLDSFFRINYSDRFDVRLGQFKYNFSREQITSDADLELINKSYVGSELVNPTREIGAEISKTFKNTPLKPFVALGGFNGSGPNSTAQNDYGASVARLLLSPSEGFSVGGALYDGRTGAAKTAKTRRGVEAMYENRKAGPPILFKSEYITGADGKTDKSGYYLTAGYYVLRLDNQGGPHILLLARYDYFDGDGGAKDDEISRTTVGFVAQHDNFVSVRLNYEMINETPSAPNDLLTWQFQIKF